MPSTASTPWQTAEVERVTVETHRAKTFTLRLSDPRAFRAGQHYDVRLTAPDGYQAQRSYSVASAPVDNASGSADTIDLTVELISDGEVSPYFHEVVQPGDVLEVRGPIGGPFTWTEEMGGPLFLLAGGSGIVPLRSMLAHRESVAPGLPTLLLYSVRTPGGHHLWGLAGYVVHPDPARRRGILIHPSTTTGLVGIRPAN